MADQQVPSVGRVVHYVLPAGPRRGEHRAAIVTRLEPERGPAVISINLQLAPGDLPTPDTAGLPEHWAAKERERVHSISVVSMDHVFFDEEMNEGTWHWPEFVSPLGVTGKEAW